MKTVNWLIERDVFDSSEALLTELKRQNCPYKSVKYLDFHPRRASDYFPDHDCVLFRGSLGLGRDMLRTTWIPGAYMDQRNLSCSVYYTHYGEHLLNNQYFLLPLAELIRRRTEILDYFDSGGELFIRPDSNMKLFRAGVFDLSVLNTLAALSSELKRDKTTLVLVGRKQPITREWRFFAYKDEIITGSLYLTGEEQINSSVEGGYLRDYAASIVNQVAWHPEIVYTIDICESAGELHVLELGSFSCAGAYGCDLGLIVEMGVRAAREEWCAVNDDD
ncbi:MAG: ATP-grasp domain-containing protein [Cyanobacteria bacterium J06576_12]